MALKNPFKAVPIEMGERYRAPREGEPAQAERSTRRAMLKLAAWGILGGVALGGTALLVRSQDFSWVFKQNSAQTPAQTAAETPTSQPQP